MKRILYLILSAALTTSLIESPAFAADTLVTNVDFLKIVDGTTASTSTEVALPSSVILSTNSVVEWGFTGLSLTNELGDSYLPESGIWSRVDPFTIKVEKLGRRAQFTFSSAIAVTAKITLFAIVNNASYISTKSVTFLPATPNGAYRYELGQLPKDFKIEIDNPDPGSDLITFIRARITGTGNWPTQNFTLSVANYSDSGKQVTPGVWASWEVSVEEYNLNGFTIQAAWRVPAGPQRGNSTQNIEPIFTRKIPVTINFSDFPMTADNTTISFECSYIDLKKSYSCKVGLDTTATKNLPAPIAVQSRVDGKAWGISKRLSLMPGKSVVVSIPYIKSKSRDFRAVYNRDGFEIVSDLSSWVTKSAASQRPFTESILRGALKANCSNLPSRITSYKFSEKGYTFNNYGDVLFTYGLQLVDFVVYSTDTYWQIGPNSTLDSKLLDVWECTKPMKVKK
jgi:hypothetical protein